MCAASIRAPRRLRRSRICKRNWPTSLPAMQRNALDLNAAGSKLAPPFPPIVVNRAAQRPGSRLRVVLLNAAGGKRFPEIVACLKRPPLQGADVILLCETNAAGTKPSARRDVAVEMAS